MASNTEAPNTLLSNSTFRVLDLVCEGPIKGFRVRSGQYGADPLCSTYYDDVPVRNPDGSYNYNITGGGYSFDYTLGTPDQTGITGFQKVELVVPLSSNTRIANPPAGAGPYKTVVATINSNTFPDADGVKVTVRIPALFAQDANANTNPYTITYAVDISLNGGDWVEMDQITVDGKCTSAYQKTTAYTLPKTNPPLAYYEWKIRVRRVSQNILSIKTQNEIYVDSIAIVSNNLYAYPNSVIVGTAINADQFSSIPTRAYEIDGMLMSVPSGYSPTQYPTTGGIVPATYPNVWDGTFQTGVWTDNPAWIFYDLLTNQVHGLGDYVQSSYVDKWTLYKISQYCDAMVDDGAGGQEPRFTANVAIQQPDDAYSVLLNLASTFRGMLYYANGAIHASQNQDEAPVFAFTNANVVNGVFTYSDTARNTRSTVARVKWVDPQNGYRENVEYIEDVDGILRYGYQEKETTAFACTSRGQAYRLGSWMLQSERLLTETVTFQTDMEGVALKPGDNFAVYDNFRNNRDQAGRVTSFTSGRSLIWLDRPVAIEPGYTYSLSCIIPKQQLDATGDVTGSTQISQIRQSQIESFAVTNGPTSGTSFITIQGAFSQNLYQGSPFILSASGLSANIVNRASFYTCLATAEVEPGKIEVLGLQANTGIQFAIQTGYTVVEWPINPGDTNTSISPPSNLLVTGVTGADNNNTFYSAISLTWRDSPSSNLSHYIVSGKTFDTAYSVSDPIFGTGYNFTRSETGLYQFRLAAVSQGGVYSSWVTGGFLVSSQNPLGIIRPLSGVRLVDGMDPLYVNATTGYTGYVGLTPTFEWQELWDNNGLPIVDMQFVSGYRLDIRSYDGSTTYWGPYDISGVENNTFTLTGGQIYSFPGGPQRGWEFRVQTIDIYGQVATGASLKVNNPPMKAPFASGFNGFNGGLIYNVTPSLQYDTSGVYLWVSQNPSFTPTYSNYNYSSSNLAGTANIAPQTGSFYTWFALQDTFGTTGNPIWGPVSGNTNQIFSAFDDSIGIKINGALNDISGAYNLITGQITNSINLVSGQNLLTIQSVNALSGEITGSPGVVNTALNIRVNTITVNASGALSQQIDAVKANMTLTGQTLTAQVGSVSTALTNSGVALGQRIDVTTANINTLSGNIAATGANLLSSIATTGGALSQWITYLGAQTSGFSSSVQVAARAFVTGSSNGIGGAAVASWGFKLDANGKVVSMVASSSTLPNQEQGTIVLGNADLQSDGFSAGSAGWRIRYNGNSEFNNVVVRGDFTGGSSSSLVSANSAGLKVGDPAGDYISVLTAPSSRHVIQGYNQTNHANTFQLGNVDVGGGVVVGQLQLNNDLGSNKITLDGSAGLGTFAGGVTTNGALTANSSATFNSTLAINGATTVSTDVLFHGAGNDLILDDNNKISFSRAGTSSYLTEDYGVNIYGEPTRPVHIRGGALVRGATAGGSYSAGDLYGFGIVLDPGDSLPNSIVCPSSAGSDHSMANFLEVKHATLGTIYIPYFTSP